MPDTENNIQEQGIPEITMEVEASTNVQTPIDKTLSIADMAADAKAVGDAIVNLESAISDLNSDIEDVDAKTGESIPVSTDDNAPTIQEAIESVSESITGVAFPVGTILMTIDDEEPAATGTWVEIFLPMTWGDLKHGTRSYRQVEDGEDTGTVHFWLRTA